MKKEKVIPVAVAAGIVIFISATIIVAEKLLRVSSEFLNDHAYADLDDFDET